MRVIWIKKLIIFCFCLFSIFIKICIEKWLLVNIQIGQCLLVNIYTGQWTVSAIQYIHTAHFFNITTFLVLKFA